MKRILSIAAAGAVALSLLSGCAAKTSGEAVSVESVAMITGVGTGSIVDCYAGKVVSGETAELKKDGDKTVLEVYVEEGDMVDKGDVLFSYDTEAMQLNLDKLYLDRESYDNTISAAEAEIQELQTQKSKADSSQQLSYTLQIDARQADIREAEYNRALKDKEIQTMEASMDKTEVLSPLSGRVMSVSDPDVGDGSLPGGDMPGGTSSDAFITVMDVSAYRVEGRINELNYGQITEGMRVLVRSRMDGDRVWFGVIDSIDWEKPVTSNNNNMYMGMSGDDMTTSSKYPFYVVLDETEDLILGQHVYIEPDFGQENEQPAMMLPAFYIVDDSFVWAADSRDKLEKRTVTLGAYDEDMDQYEILGGLTPEDYIAFPAEGLAAGMDVVRYDESSFGGDDFFPEEGMEGFDAGLGDLEGYQGDFDPAAFSGEPTEEEDYGADDDSAVSQEPEGGLPAEEPVFLPEEIRPASDTEPMG